LGHYYIRLPQALAWFSRSHRIIGDVEDQVNGPAARGLIFLKTNNLNPRMPGDPQIELIAVTSVLDITEMPSDFRVETGCPRLLKFGVIGWRITPEQRSPAYRRLSLSAQGSSTLSGRGTLEWEDRAQQAAGAARTRHESE
jgi:hypothetical protein